MKRLALVMLLLWSDITIAQTRMDCPVPTQRGFGLDASDIERLDVMISLQEYQLCWVRNLRNEYGFFHPAAHEAFFDAFEEFRSIEIDLYKSRLSVPSAFDIREILQEFGRNELGQKFSDFEFAIAVIYEQEQCAQNPVFNRNRVFDCPLHPMGTKISEKYGLELRPWVEKIAAELRPQPIPPWFRLGAVSVRYEPNSLAHLRLKTALEEAGRGQSEVQVELASRR